MSKVKLVYEKQLFDIKKDSEMPFDYSYCKIADLYVPEVLIKNNIEVVKKKQIWGTEHLLVLKSNDSKKILRMKIIIILNHFCGEKIQIKYLR